MSIVRRPPKMGMDELGEFFQHDDGSLWRLITYAAEPTARLECVFDAAGTHQTGERVGGVVGARIFEPFRKLVAEES